MKSVKSRPVLCLGPKGWMGLWPGLVVILLVVAARLVGSLQSWEWQALDLGLRLRPWEPMDEQIVVVGITEADIQSLQAYPISDQALAQLLGHIRQYQPRVVGLDLFRDFSYPPGREALGTLLATMPNLIGIDTVLPDPDGTTIPPPRELPLEQVGFADVLPDADGKLRRSLLGVGPSQNYRLSFAVLVAQAYLKKEGRSLENGRDDPLAMRFGQTELSRFHAQTGGYVGADDGGNQMLLNYRHSRRPFRRISMADLRSGQVDLVWLRDRIVLIGVTSNTQKDWVSTAAVAHPSTGLEGVMFGVEAQAHAISQIINAELADRPLLTAWPEIWEYLWIVAWGSLGLLLWRWTRLPWLHFLIGLGLGWGLLAVAWGCLLNGIWIPVVPPLLGFGFNAVVLYSFALYDQGLRSRIQDRQQVIDGAFDAIHNGPLQTLAGVLRGVCDRTLSLAELEPQLQHLNQDLRSIYDLMRQETLNPEPVLGLSSDFYLDLTGPLHELLYSIYSETLARDLPGFSSIKLKITKFEPMGEQALRPELKRALCRFLEELLCNIGKHATDVTELSVTCMQVQQQNMIQVSDNGNHHDLEPARPPHKGWGTQQAKHLAQTLGGTFQKEVNHLFGQRCCLTWPVQRQPFWKA